MKPEVGRLVGFTVILAVYLAILAIVGPITNGILLLVVVLNFLVPVIGIFWFP